MLLTTGRDEGVELLDLVDSKSHGMKQAIYVVLGACLAWRPNPSREGKVDGTDEADSRNSMGLETI